MSETETVTDAHVVIDADGDTVLVTELFADGDCSKLIVFVTE